MLHNEKQTGTLKVRSRRNILQKLDTRGCEL